MILSPWLLYIDRVQCSLLIVLLNVNTAEKKFLICIQNLKQRLNKLMEFWFIKSNSCRFQKILLDLLVVRPILYVKRLEKRKSISCVRLRLTSLKVRLSIAVPIRRWLKSFGLNWKSLLTIVLISRMLLVML